MAEPTDFDLMSQIQSGDRRAHFILKDRYQHRLFEIAYATLKDPHRAEEVVQRVFESSWREATIFDLERHRSVAVWLYGLTGGLAKKQAQRWQRPDLMSPGQRWRLVGVGGLLLVFNLTAGLLTWRSWQQREASLPLPSLTQLYQEWQKQPDVQRFSLRDPQFRTTTMAQALWSSQRRQVLLLATQLPPPPQGKVYQLWASASLPLPGQPRPVEMTESLGLFTSNPDGTLEWISSPLRVATPQKLKITLEPEVGSARPSGAIQLESTRFNP